MIKELGRIRPLFARRDKGMYVALLVMMGLGSLLDVIGVGAIPAFVATLAVPDKVMEHPLGAKLIHALGISDGQELVVWGCLGLIVVFLLKNAYLSFLHYAQIRITEVHRVRLSDRLFRAYLEAPYEFILSKNSAELLRNVQVETKEILTGVINPILNVLMGFLMTIGIVLLLILTMPPIVWSAAGVVGLASWIFLRVFRKRLKQYGLESKRERKESIRAVNQGLGALVDARVLGTIEYFARAFQRSMAHYAHVDRLRQFIAKSSPLILESVAVIGLLVIVLGLVLSGTDAASMVPTLALFGAAVVRLRTSTGQIVAGITQMNYSAAAIPVVTGDLRTLESKLSHRTPGSKGKRKSRVQPLPFENEVRLRNVTYSYPNAPTPALQEVDLSIERGSRIGFVGSTGSGKSTLVNVVLGLLQPQQGTVEVDGVNVFDEIARWRANIGYVPQTIYLLDDTIRSNIALGLRDDEVEDDRVWEAVHAAQLESYVQSLPDGLDTVVGERGARISGGQRQRIGLARALYHQPQVLIMDEGTSALDNQTESLVMRAIDDLAEGRTIIMVAHRLTTVRKCDRLYFLRDGVIDASGTFEELSQTHGEFKQMAEAV